MRSRVRLDDSGQGMVPLMLLVAFSTLAIMFWLFVPWGAATTEKAQTQTAADAAALAAAQSSREIWDTGTRAPGLTYLGAYALATSTPAAGCASGSDYASRNRARMTGCRPGTDGGRSTVRLDVVANNTSDPETGLAEATATAEMDIDFGSCQWDAPPPESAPPPVGTGPYTFNRTLTCGGWEAEYELGNVPGIWPTITMTSPTDPTSLYNGLEPRLVD